MPRPEEHDPYAAKAAVDRAKERTKNFNTEGSLKEDLVHVLGLALKLPLLRRLRRDRPSTAEDAEPRIHRDV